MNWEFILAYNIQLLPILVSLLIISGVLLWVGIRVHRNWFLMFLLIPLTMFCAWNIYQEIDKLLGYPVYQEIKQDSIYIHHVISFDGEVIYVWIYVPGESRPKAIIVPNTENNQEQLEKAQQEAEEGKAQLLGMELQEGQGETQGGELYSYEFQPTGPDIHKDQSREEERQRGIAGPVERRPGPSTTRPSLSQNYDDRNEIPHQHNGQNEVNPFELEFEWPDGFQP